MNYKRIGVVLVCAICFFSLIFNVIEFGVNQALLNANHSLEKYARDYNCGMFGTSAYSYLDENSLDSNKLYNIGK